ncbi:nickel pincer cofactor biosynthesis protein LarB [bacterium]|nr:nickel pincer cofactor biosynthesis protein LarB [bacterium]MBU1613773.1 nickel pincer cofactor biosynthesis protein LarB [bacterium]
MNRERIKEILGDFKSGRLKLDEALNALKAFPYEDLGFAKLDTHRSLRKGFAECIFCPGKTIDQIVRIVEKLKEEDGVVLATKASGEIYEAVRRVNKDALYYETARIILIGKPKKRAGKGTILIVSGGTSDIPIAEEAAVTAEVMGNKVERLYDVGVAGVHRLFDHKEKLFLANVIIVVAGMEGALSSIVGGMVEAPVVAVPTSVGYGASFKGLSALLTMLNSCAPGVVVVNIDNGFGAGYSAGIINRMGKKG